MQRRSFLTGLSAISAGSILPACAGRAVAVSAGASSASATPASSVLAWDEVRRQFPLDPSWIHMSQFFMTSHPAPVRRAIDEHRRRLDENPFAYIEENVERFETTTRKAASRYLACQPDDLAMTDSTTMGLGTFYGGLRLREGQEILSTTHDHPATFVALDQHTARTGTVVRRIPLYDVDRSLDANADAMADALARAIRPTTRIVAVTWVHSASGVKTPIARFAQAVAAANRGRAESDRALLCVDGVHGFGIEDETPASLGCDAFMAGCHKWLFGPRGTGLVCANRAAWDATTPTMCSFDRMWRHGEQPPAANMTPGGFHSFEHRWALEAAFRFHEAIGKARIARRIHELNDQLKAGLSKMQHVKLFTPRAPELSAGIVCFEVNGMTPEATVAKLKERKVIASVAPYTTKHARLSPSLLTSEADVEASLSAVRALA